MILYGSLTEGLVEDPGEILSKRSLHEDLADAMSQRCACIKACGRLLGGPRDLVSPLRQQQLLLWRSCGRSWSRSVASPCEKVLWGSGWNAVKGFSMFRSLWALEKRSWWNPLYVLAWSRTGPCEKILWRSCWNPPQEVLALRSWRSSALVLVWNFFWDAHRKFLYEDLVSSSI